MAYVPIRPEGGIIISNKPKNLDCSRESWQKWITTIGGKLIAENDEYSDLIRRVQLSKEQLDAA